MPSTAVNRARLPSAFTLLAASLLIAGSAAASTEQRTAMEVVGKADQLIVAGSPNYFNGEVTITGQFQRPEPSRVGGAIIRFERGARANWHTHPLGQTLIVTEGVGWTQIEGGPSLISRRGYSVVPPRSQALARGDAARGHEPHRNSGILGRLPCHLDAEGDGPAIQARPGVTRAAILLAVGTVHASCSAGQPAHSSATGL